MGAGAPVLNYASGVRITIDGNSVAKGQGAVESHWDAQMINRAPFNGNAPIINIAQDGWTITNMIASGSSADATFDPTKKNILIAWEGNNEIDNLGKTPQQAIDKMTQYCAERLAVHPWLIVMATNIPKTTDAVINGKHIVYDNLLKANYRAMGAKICIDFASVGGAFAFDYTNSANFGLYQADTVHPNPTGNFELAKIFAAALRRVPKR